jgi:hypothetical protein
MLDTACSTQEKSVKAFTLVSYSAYFFAPEDGGDMILRNVAWHSTDYTALQPPAFRLDSCSDYIFDPEDGGGMILRNVGWHSMDYTVLYPRRWYSSQPPLWELQITHLNIFCFSYSTKLMNTLEEISIHNFVARNSTFWTVDLISVALDATETRPQSSWKTSAGVRVATMSSYT